METVDRIATLEHLFDVEWRIDPDAETVVPATGRDGVLIGNGHGVAAGPRLNGAVRFSFYAAECPYDPGSCRRPR
jgi:hypothetical protein